MNKTGTDTRQATDWRAAMAAANGDTVKQGHADYCAANGHASWVVDGVDCGLCARCGDVIA